MVKKIKRPNIDIPWLGGSNTSGTTVELRGQKSKPVPASRGKGGVANNTTFPSNQDNSYYDRSGQPGGSRFVKTVPTFPQPQPIKNMPPQLAGFTDYARAENDLRKPERLPQNKGGSQINVAGKIAKGIEPGNEYMIQDFLNTKSVFINPMYKDPYDKVGNDPDSSDRSRFGPQLRIPESRREALMGISKGVNKFAEATSQYFDKPVVVGKSPRYSRGAPTTTDINIWGEEAGMEFAGYVGWSNASYTPAPRKVLKAPGGENRVTKAKALQKNMTLNTDLDYMTKNQWASTTQHEFGHTMGFGHAHTNPKGTTLNSEMSYDAPDHDATILPATINAYKKVMDKNYGYTGVEDHEKDHDKQADAFYKLQKLNQKYEKKKKK